MTVIPFVKCSITMRLLEVLPFRVVSIHGAPRSGTSWLGQIFNSHPEVAYRFQPLFSYRFKGAITPDSTRDEIEGFLQDLFAIENDEFILQTKQRERRVHPIGLIKHTQASQLVMKEVRYHYLIETLFRQLDSVKVIGIVRHPCGAINSWLKTPREFKPEWNELSEWRQAQSKNQGRPEEYYGFEKWCELASLFLSLSRRYPDAFRLVRYEELVRSPHKIIKAIFTFCGLDFSSQTSTFLTASQSNEVEDPDTVFRTPDVAERWENELRPEIRDYILRELNDSELRVFL